MVQMNEDSAADYLEAFGYLQQAHDDFQEAVRLFQVQFGDVLKADGVLGPKTLRAMATPRCGLADHMEEEANVLRRWPARDWTKQPLTFRIAKYVEGIDQAEQRRVLVGAWEAWEKVCNIGLALVNSDTADITISAGRGRADSFDSAGGTLAWAQLPDGRSGSPLIMKFDLDENWVASSAKRGTLLFNVACHEYGHLLGCNHLSDNNLMAPFYSPAIAVPQAGDIAEMVKRYGKPIQRPEGQPPSDAGLVLRLRDRDSLTIDGYRLTKV
jgi:hypothetical protein